MTRATKFSTRVMRRRGHKDGEAIGQEIIDRFASRFIDAATAAALEQEMEAFGVNRLGRAVQEIREEGAPSPAALQYQVAVAAGMADKLHVYRAAIDAAPQRH